MPYSHLLMTLIFIKLRLDGAGDPFISPVLRGRSRRGCYAD